jgi:hypothetical protein
MDSKELIEIIEDCENRPNAQLIEVNTLLQNEFEETKKMILQLTEHLDKLEECYNRVNEEIKKRGGQ